jgi:quercetin dioxygenase-like cupin family protein
MLAVVVLVLLSLSTAPGMAQVRGVGVAGAGTLVVKRLADKQVATLPTGPLFWRVERFATVAEAQAAAGPMGLVAQSDGRVWLCTVGPAGGSSRGGLKVAEIGPLPPLAAPRYLLRVNEASGPPGSRSPAHSHPGVEAAYVLAGEQTFRMPSEVERVGAGKGMASRAADTPMQVSSSGSENLHALIMFVVDATRPFSSPAELP